MIAFFNDLIFWINIAGLINDERSNRQVLASSCTVSVAIIEPNKYSLSFQPTVGCLFSLMYSPLQLLLSVNYGHQLLYKRINPRLRVDVPYEMPHQNITTEHTTSYCSQKVPKKKRFYCSTLLILQRSLIVLKTFTKLANVLYSYWLE